MTSSNYLSKLINHSHNQFVQTHWFSWSQNKWLPSWVSHWITDLFNYTDSIRYEISSLCSVFFPQKDRFTRARTCNCLHFECGEFTLLKNCLSDPAAFYLYNKKTSCHVTSAQWLVGPYTQYVQTAFRSSSMALSAEMRTLHINSQACTSPLSAHSCSRLSFHVYSSQAQASIVPHFLYMVFSSAAAPARQRKMSLVH